MPYIYGPIPSRRLGQSLGVDPILLKTCNWNCVYCQLGTDGAAHQRTAGVRPGMRSWRPCIMLGAPSRGDIDLRLVRGVGEPTLHVGLGWMLRRTKALTSIPVAVITNGSLLYRPDVRAELAVADVVMPTLVAGTASLFRRINRPHPELTFARQVDGLVQFRRREYAGKLWIEAMLIRDLNDDAGPHRAGRRVAADSARRGPHHVARPAAQRNVGRAARRGRSHARHGHPGRHR
ncbi:MAG: hypothetical protein R2851_15480 [Caldilineaceae bacterium]